MRGLPEIPDEDVAEYWQLVRAALVATGMSKEEAKTAAKAYRAFMKPAGWALYNTDPERSAEYAKDYAAWMREEQVQATSKAKTVPKRAKQPTKNADKLPSRKEIKQLSRWAKVAFAARCARRVEPLYLKHWPRAPQEYVMAVERAVEVAEQAASAADAAAADAAAAAADAAYSAASAAVTNTSSASASSAADAAASAYSAAYSAASTSASASASSSARSAGLRAIPVIRQDFERIREAGQQRNWTHATPVPPAVFGPLWPEGPLADWPELPKPTKLKLSVQVPDWLDDAAVREKLQKLTTALARLNVAGGGHGLELIRPIVFTQEPEKGRADVVGQESKKPKGRDHPQGGR